jgi:phosphoribosylamine--glycine ligase
VLCSKGYPGNYKSLIHIKNLKKLFTKKNEFIFHAGTKIDNTNIISYGGRVLNFTVLSEKFKTSRDKAIKLIKKLNWKNGFFRNDIGFKVINK